MLTEQEQQLIMIFPETDYGRAFFKWIQMEIDALDSKSETVGKICDDPLIEDFRTQMGIKIGLKRALRKPQELKEQKHKGVMV